MYMCLSFIAHSFTPTSALGVLLHVIIILSHSPSNYMYVMIMTFSLHLSLPSSNSACWRCYQGSIEGLQAEAGQAAWCQHGPGCCTVTDWPYVTLDPLNNISTTVQVVKYIPPWGCLYYISIYLLVVWFLSFKCVSVYVSVQPCVVHVQWYCDCLFMCTHVLLCHVTWHQFIDYYNVLMRKLTHGFEQGYWAFFSEM